jgi:hypothetical protein
VLLVAGEGEAAVIWAAYGNGSISIWSLSDLSIIRKVGSGAQGCHHSATCGNPARASCSSCCTAHHKANSKASAHLQQVQQDCLRQERLLALSHTTSAACRKTLVRGMANSPCQV